MSSLLGYLTTLAKIGGPVLGMVGLLVWYKDRRAGEQHEAEQSQIDRLYERVEELEAKVGEQRQELGSQHDKIVEQGRLIATLRSDLASAELAKGRKDAEIERLQAKVETLEHQVYRLRQNSDPSIGTAPTEPQNE